MAISNRWIKHWTVMLLIVLMSIMPVWATKVMDDTYHHILVISDIHYPTKSRNTFDEATKTRIISNKTKVMIELNRWEDVELVAYLGDFVADGGAPEEYKGVQTLMGLLQKPYVAVAGNHEWSYVDKRNEKGKLALAGPEMRKAKYDTFNSIMGIKDAAYRTKTIGNYFLVFLSPDLYGTKHLVEINDTQIQWFKEQLESHKDMPTIVFFHAPLLGTLMNYEEDINVPKKVAQPVGPISEILAENPQVFMWVSGHTHTSPETASFAHPINLYQGRVVNIHNPSWEQEPIWTNSIFLFPDKVLVRTFNHEEGEWEEEYDRIFPTLHIGKTN